MKIKVEFDAKQILASRGLGATKKVQKYLASEVKRLSDKYVPMQQGMLKNNAQIAGDGSFIVYNQPYAHYQWYGKVMAGRAPKHYTDDDLTYNGAPMRGARWTERMMIDKKEDIEKSVEAFIKRGK